MLIINDIGIYGVQKNKVAGRGWQSTGFKRLRVADALQLTQDQAHGPEQYFNKSQVYENGEQYHTHQKV